MSATAQAGTLVQLALRRDRLQLGLWLGGIVLLTLVVAQAYTALVPTAEERQAMALTMANPAVTAMFGPGYSLDNYHFGAIMGHQMLLFSALLVAIMNILLAARHSRTQEEAGGSELLRAQPVGRLAELAAAGALVAAANVALALLVAIGLYSLQIEPIDLAGSLLYGAVLGACGLWFAAATLAVAQLVPNGRATVGMAVALLVISYLVRAIGDVAESSWSWLSPLGWVVRSEVYAANRWLPVGLLVISALALFGLAAYLNAQRDLGAGLLPARAGRPQAPPHLASPLALAWRLSRTALSGWAAGMAVLGASYGSVLGDLEGYLEAIALLQRLLVEAEGLSLTEQFLPMLMVVLAIIGGVPVLLAILRLNGEERSGRLEHLAARPVARWRLLASFVALSLACGLVMPLVAALGMWLAAGATGTAVALSTLIGAAAAYVPALWVTSSVAALLIGLWPKRASLAWWYLGYGFFAMYLGALLQLPDWVTALTPFGHTPRYPLEPLTAGPLIALSALAAALALAGLIGYRKRDLG